MPIALSSASKQKVIVTGGLGYIGSHVVVSLLETGKYEPIIVDNCHNANARVVQACADIASSTLGYSVAVPKLYNCDVRDGDAWTRVFQENAPVWGVIHLAAMKSVGESTEIPLKYYDVNVGGSVALLKAMGEHGCSRLVFSSSATVYGDPEVVPIPETSKISPQSPYGATKAVVEDIIQASTKASGLRAISIRYFNPAGAHPSGRLGEDPVGRPNNLLPLLAQVATGRITTGFKVFGDDYPTRDGTCIRDYIHIMDLAEGHVLALAALQDDTAKQYRVYNLGRGQGLTVLEMIEAMRKATGKELTYVMEGRRPGDVTNLTADPSRAEEQLGFKAKRGLDEMCEDLWRFQMQNDGVKSSVA